MTSPSMIPGSNTSYFYLRKYNLSDRGFHRFGCIALGKTAEPGVLHVTYSLLAPGDRFNANYARKSAIGRLNSLSHCATIHVEDINKQTHPLWFIFKSLNIAPKIIRNHSDIAEDKCSRALNGALLELTDRPRYFKDQSVTSDEDTVLLPQMIHQLGA